MGSAVGILLMLCLPLMVSFIVICLTAAKALYNEQERLVTLSRSEATTS